MKISEEQLNLVLEKVANNFNIKEWRFIPNEIDKTIENYFGILVLVTLFGVGNEREIQKDIFIKFAPGDVPYKSTVRHIFEAEEYTYMQLIPIYKRITNVDINAFIPECYYANLEPNHEVLVLKDMRSCGFKRFDKKRFLDMNNLRVTLETLATFHSLSIIYRETGGDFDNIRMKPFTDTHIETHYSYIKDSLRTHLLYSFNGTIYESYLKILLSDFVNSVISSTTEVKYLVYGHGDLWKENIMFKYENSAPIQACLVDFQMSRRMSPAQDILYLLLTNGEVTNEEQHRQYITIYFDKLHSVLNKNGLGSIYSVNDMDEDIKIVAPYTIANTLMSFSFWLGLERNKMLEVKGDGNYEKNLIIFKRTLINILEGLNKLGYINL